MVQKIAKLFFLLSIVIASCGERYPDCEKEETITLKLADTLWARNVLKGNLNSSWISSNGFLQSVAMKETFSNRYYNSNVVDPPVKIEVDKCRRYIAKPLSIGFYPSIYPVAVSFELTHNPFSQNIQLMVIQEDMSSDYKNQFYEEVVFSLTDTSLSTISELSNYYSSYTKPAIYYSKATLFPSFTGISGRTFSTVYKVPLEAFRIIEDKSKAIRLVWIAKELGIVQYELANGQIWCMK